MPKETLLLLLLFPSDCRENLGKLKSEALKDIFSLKITNRGFLLEVIREM